MEGQEEGKTERKNGTRCGHRRRRSRFHKLLFLVVPIGVIAALGLYGLTHAHGRFLGDPERLEKKMAWIQEDVADELDLRDDQRPAFDALAEKFKAHVRGRVAGWKQTGSALKSEFDQVALDADRVSALIKERIHNRASDTELEALVDEATTFYKTLDAEQQATFREKVAKHLNRHLL